MTIRAIIVDDNQDVRELLTFLVLEAGAEVVDAVADGLTALAVLTTGPVDLVVTDYQMPGMDGIALARHVLQQYPETTVVLVTGLITPDRKQAALDVGIRHVLMKPVRLETMARLVTNLFP